MPDSKLSIDSTINITIKQIFAMVVTLVVGAATIIGFVYQTQNSISQDIRDQIQLSSQEIQDYTESQVEEIQAKIEEISENDIKQDQEIQILKLLIIRDLELTPEEITNIFNSQN